MHQIGLIEDNFFLRNTYKEYIESFKDFKISFALESVEDFQNAIRSKMITHLDLVLLDIELPGLSGLDAINFIKQAFPNTKVMMLTNSEEQKTILTAIKNGADGYIVKTSLFMELSKAISDLFSIGAYLSPLASKKIIEHFNNDVTEEISTLLTKRELELVKHVKSGHSYKKMAELMFVSTATVNFHMNNIFKKLNVTNRGELIAYLLSKNNVFK